MSDKKKAPKKEDRSEETPCCEGEVEESAPEAEAAEGAETTAEEGARPAWSVEAVGDTVRKGYDQVKETARALAHDAMEFIAPRMWEPRVDLYVQGPTVVVLADIPGATREDIEVIARANALTIRGTRPVGPDPSEDLEYRERKRRTGDFKREVALPVAVDSENVTAKLSRGVLEIRMQAMPETTVKPERGEFPAAAEETKAED